MVANKRRADFPSVPSDKRRDNECKLKHRRFPLNIRKHIFNVRFNKHWHRVVQASCGVFLLGDIRKPLVQGPGLSEALLEQRG